MKVSYRYGGISKGPVEFYNRNQWRSYIRVKVYFMIFGLNIIDIVSVKCYYNLNNIGLI